jgi:homoserine dehydrogenase
VRDIFLIQLGLGGVGRALARQIVQPQVAGRLAARYGLRLRYLALVDSRGARFDPDGLAPSDVAAAIARKAAGQALAQDHPAERWGELLPERSCIVVDTTAAAGMEGALVEAVGAGHRVVLANKRPLTAALASFHGLTSTGATRYEATVGAGLPVIGTLQSLLDSGDELLRVEACLSGTLGYLCSELEQGASFSSAVTRAGELGYTEPDPRDDLNGGDVARKALILARTAGFAWAAEPVQSQPLFPMPLAGLSVAEFMGALPSLDAEYEARLREAEARGEALRYVATIDPEGAQVALAALPGHHALAALRGPDNLVAFTTARYRERPLVVRGPGAGAEVTAAGVLGDLVASARELS